MELGDLRPQLFGRSAISARSCLARLLLPVFLATASARVLALIRWAPPMDHRSICW